MTGILFASLPGSNAKLVLLAAIVLGTAFYAVHLALWRWASLADAYLFPVVALLSTIGLALIYRIRPELAARQIVWVLAGLTVVAAVAIFRWDYHRLEELKYFYVFLGLFFLVITALLGTTAGGARSWLRLGSFQFEPAEIVKLLTVVFLAIYLKDTKEFLKQKWRLTKELPPPQVWGPLIGTWGLFLLLLVVQKDLGTALIFYMTFLSMIYLVSNKGSLFLAGLVFLVVGGVIAYYLFPHVQARVAIWLHPWSDLEGAGFQISQSLFALGTGGMLGTGIGLGYPGLIPAAHTDFILSVAGEELGFLGVAGILMLYMIFAYRGFKIALEAPDELGTLLSAGLTLLVSLHVIVISSGVTGMLPLTGITLPFISYGGSSMIINYAILALLLNVSRSAGQGTKDSAHV